MDSASIKPARLWLILGGLWLLAATALPWYGFDFTVGPVLVQLHSLKNPTGAIFLLLGLSPLVPTFRGWFLQRVNTLERWGAESPDCFVWAGAAVAGLILCNVKLYQHFALQTHAFDLGILANVCWNTLHGRLLHDGVKGRCYLADHFQPILFVLSGALLLWNNTGVYMLVQASGFAFGVPPLFRLTEKATGSRTLALGLCLVYLTRPSVNAVNGFDLHPEALAVPILLWALWFLDQERPMAFWICCLITLTIKEDAPIGLASLGLVIALTKTSWKKTGWTLFAVSIAAFFYEILVVIPHFLNGMPSVHFIRYMYLGDSYQDIVKNMVLHPIHFIALVTSPAAKESAFFRFLGSFGFLPLLDPLGFFPGFMALLLHLASGYSGQYTLSGQYTAFGLPYILAASAVGLGRAETFLRKRTGHARAWLFAACLVFSGGGLLTNSRYAKPVDWNRLRQFYQLTDTIPPEASVRAQSDLLPHVCLRKVITLFAPYDGYQYLPLFEASRADTDYILLDRLGNCWPMEKPQYEQEVLKLQQEGRYRLIDERSGYELWKKNPT